MCRKENKKLKGGLRLLDKRVKKSKNRRIRTQKGEEGKGGGGIRENIRDIERRIKMKEKEERRKNSIMKEMVVKEGKRREATESILKEMEANVKVEEVREIRKDKEKGTDMI